MRKVMGVSVGLFVVVMGARVVRAVDPAPWWAYGVPELPAGAPATPPPAAAPAPGRGAGAPGNGTPGGGTPAAGRQGGQPQPARSIEGSKFQFTTQEISNGFGPADWFPEDHPVMPDIVAHGRHAPDARACALCHLPNGNGRPENAPPRGQTFDYIMLQLNDFRHDLRHSAEPRKENTAEMISIAKALTDEEMKAAATYFSSMKWMPWIRVVETNDVPRTRIQGNIFFSLGDGTTEPIGNRIIESPEDNTQTQLRNPRVGFVAYVPVGSIKKGEALATTGGNGKTIPCFSCHGPDLKGNGPIPSIAGRSPSYLVRQLYDIQAGTRNGTITPLMKPVVQNLNTEDMVNLIAYVSSRPVN